MRTFSIKNQFLLLLLVFVLNPVSTVRATQDVVEPDAIIGFMKMVMVRPEITGEIQRLVDEGCSWVQEIFWSGSPSETDLNTRTFWKTFSIQFETQNGVTHWVPFSFRYNKDGIVQVEIPSKELGQIRCQLNP